MHNIRYRRINRATLIGAFCASFLAGAWTAVLGSSLVLLAAGLILAVFCRKRLLILALPAILLAGFLLGSWRGGAMAADILVYKHWYGQKVELQGRVAEDPAYDDKGQTDLMLGGVSIEGKQIPGQVRVKGFMAADVRRGDVVKSTAKLYDGFADYQASMYYAQITVMSQNNNPVDDFRQAFAASIYSNLPEPQASLGLGFLLGLKSQLPASLDDQLKILGLTHVVVASGYNLTILVRLARRLFEKTSAYQTMVAAALLILGFLAVTGLSPSISRAAMVTGLALLAWYYGQRFHPLNLLLLTAAVTMAINPLYIWSDLGWWLSFLAFGGVMLLAPLLQARIFGRKKPRFLAQVAIETVSAQLATWPLILFVFGGFAVLSLPANLLIVPLVPLAMLLTFCAGVAGLAAGAAAPWLALPASWLLTYMTEVVKLLAAAPWAMQPLKIPAAVMVIAYALLIIVCLVLWRKTRYDFRGSSIVE